MILSFFVCSPLDYTYFETSSIRILGAIPAKAPARIAAAIHQFMMNSTLAGFSCLPDDNRTGPAT